jgi:hypothetical protein
VKLGFFYVASHMVVHMFQCLHFGLFLVKHGRCYQALDAVTYQASLPQASCTVATIVAKQNPQ